MLMIHVSRKGFSVLFLVLAVALALAMPAAAQDGSMLEGLGDDVAPAPPSIGADVPLTYFGPAPSTVQKELIGPYQLVTAGTIDHDAGTITLPLYRGQLATGESVWYIITDTNDEANAAALGLNFSAKLTYADVGNAVRPAVLESDGTVTFTRGRVDFSPELSITPGEAPNYFPPSAFSAGAVGDAEYSPLMRLTNAGGYIYNAPIVAFNVDAETLNQFCDGDVDYSILHDKVTAICPEEATVTLSLTLGWAAMTASSARSSASSRSSMDRWARTIPSARASTAPSPAKARRVRSTRSAAFRPSPPITARSGI
jgi:hypothetical protein